MERRAYSNGKFYAQIFTCPDCWSLLQKETDGDKVGT